MKTKKNISAFALLFSDKYRLKKDKSNKQNSLANLNQVDVGINSIPHLNPVLKNLVRLPKLVWFLILVSCTTDSPKVENAAVYGDNPGTINEDRPTNSNPTNIFFGFLDGEGSSSTYLDMPIDSSSSNLFIGRWKIVKLGVDENNDGNIRYYKYQDFEHKDCGISFLQFNNDGVVFENSYYKQNGTCTLYSEIDNWELIEANRFKIYVYNNIYLVDVTPTELILKYDWNFANSLYGPEQVYYYYERIQKPN